MNQTLTTARAKGEEGNEKDRGAEGTNQYLTKTEINLIKKAFHYILGFFKAILLLEEMWSHRESDSLSCYNLKPQWIYEGFYDTQKIISFFQIFRK